MKNPRIRNELHFNVGANLQTDVPTAPFATENTHTQTHVRTNNIFNNYYSHSSRIVNAIANPRKRNARYELCIYGFQFKIYLHGTHVRRKLTHAHTHPNHTFPFTVD